MDVDDGYIPQGTFHDHKNFTAPFFETIKYDINTDTWTQKINTLYI